MKNPNRHVREFAGLAIFLALAAALLPVRAQKRSDTPSRPWMDKSLSPDRRADLVIEQMTLDEKIQLVHGVGMPRPSDLGQASEVNRLRSNGGAGFIPGIERLGIPDLQMADSAYGVTRGAAKGRYSTALPSDLAGTATWDQKLMYEYGSLIGRELRAQGYNMSLGGGVNITREPRNGRNFEYQGEDPILAGKMVAQFIRGIQDQGVIGDIKHYALNDQETGRSIGDARLDRRSMRETDLLAFEIGVKEGNPGAVMCSYNRINGDYACENSYTLNDVLKKAWGFKGWVVSDWGGTHSTAKAAIAGLDQEMPGSNFFGPALKTAVEGGEVPLARLNDMVHRILRTEFAAGIIDNPPATKVPDVEAGLELAQRVAEQGIVLLKNANAQLPLNASALKSIAVIGSHADVGVLSGGGSAQVDAPGGNAVPPAPTDSEIIPGLGRGATWYPSAPLKAIRARASKAKVDYDSGTDPASAARLAKSADVAIVFVNQPASEGRDLPSLSLPGGEDALVAAVSAANAHTIVMLETGGPVTMPWIDGVSAAVQAWFPGIRGAEAIARILFGDVNPSAKLPVSFAKSEADLPHPKISGIDLAPKVVNGRTQWPPFEVDYTEGLKVGYKWFDAEDKQPLFAFGHGLSYTSFEYSGLKVTGKEVVFTLKNTGKRAGAEIAQVYVSLPPAAKEPPRRLVAWDKVQLAPGESKTVTCKLDPQFLSIFNVDKNDWELLAGDYRVFVGGSSRSAPLTGTVKEP
ncbi:MAG TPA: glycoside hydrolase family 3 C-terminal domain-containing protein [Bryobacteraceae bacterium]|nr:glycoside hydrolase family 3 C-terminal domain-containing protein [Bryobacteraceae bacterium]